MGIQWGPIDSPHTETQWRWKHLHVIMSSWVCFIKELPMVCLQQIAYGIPSTNCMWYAIKKLHIGGLMLMHALQWRLFCNNPSIWHTINKLYMAYYQQIKSLVRQISGGQPISRHHKYHSWVLRGEVIFKKSYFHMCFKCADLIYIDSRMAPYLSCVFLCVVNRHALTMRVSHRWNSVCCLKYSWSKGRKIMIRIFYGQLQLNGFFKELIWIDLLAKAR